MMINLIFIKIFTTDSVTAFWLNPLCYQFIKVEPSLLKLTLNLAEFYFLCVVTYVS